MTTLLAFISKVIWFVNKNGERLRKSGKFSRTLYKLFGIIRMKTLLESERGNFTEL
jgi:hypothetical protein